MEPASHAAPAEIPSIAVPKVRKKRKQNLGSISCKDCVQDGLPCSRRKPYCDECVEKGIRCAGYPLELKWEHRVMNSGIKQFGCNKNQTKPLRHGGPVLPDGTSKKQTTSGADTLSKPKIERRKTAPSIVPIKPAVPNSWQSGFPTPVDVQPNAGYSTPSLLNKPAGMSGSTSSLLAESWTNELFLDGGVVQNASKSSIPHLPQNGQNTSPQGTLASQSIFSPEQLATLPTPEKSLYWNAPVSTPGSTSQPAPAMDYFGLPPTAGPGRSRTGDISVGSLHSSGTPDSLWNFSQAELFLGTPPAMSEPSLQSSFDQFSIELGGWASDLAAALPMDDQTKPSAAATHPTDRANYKRVDSSGMLNIGTTQPSWDGLYSSFVDRAKPVRRGPLGGTHSRSHPGSVAGRPGGPIRMPSMMGPVYGFPQVNHVLPTPPADGNPAITPGVCHGPQTPALSLLNGTSGPMDYFGAAVAHSLTGHQLPLTPELDSFSGSSPMYGGGSSGGAGVGAGAGYFSHQPVKWSERDGTGGMLAHGYMQ